MFNPRSLKLKGGTGIGIAGMLSLTSRTPEMVPKVINMARNLTEYVTRSFICVHLNGLVGEKGFQP